MKTSNIIKYLLIITIICIISSQSVLTCIKYTGNDTYILHDDWQHTNVFFISHGYSNDYKMDNLSLSPFCFKKNVNLYINYGGFLSWPGLKVWNSTVLIEDFKFYCFSINVINFTGIILHRIGLFVDVWNLYGYCTVLKIHTPHY